MAKIQTRIFAVLSVALFVPSMAVHGGLFDNIDLGKEFKKKASEAAKSLEKLKKPGAQPGNKPSGTNVEKQNTGPASNKGNMPKADGAAAFKKLPTEIQGKIVAEADEYRRQCGVTHLTRHYYNCDCVRDDFINRRTITGPEREMTDSERKMMPGPEKKKIYSEIGATTGRNLYREAKNACIDPESIADFETKKCLRAPSRIKNYKSYCKCFGETYTKKFVAQPYLSGDFRTKLKLDSHRACKSIARY